MPDAPQADQIKHIDIGEARQLGILQEANRLFFHPRGLALEVTIHPDGMELLTGIWDYRDDPEGIIFGEGMISPAKAARVQELFDAHLEARRTMFGTDDGIQPVPDEEPEDDD